MAYTNVQSGEIPEGTQYYSGKLPLGDYNFYLKIDATGVSPKIVTKCESPDGTMRTSASRTWPAGTQITGWSVEANEAEASVYVQAVERSLNTGPVSVPFSFAASATATSSSNTYSYTGGMITQAYSTMYNPYHISASATPGQYFSAHDRFGASYSVPMDRTFTYQGLTVYYQSHIGNTWIVSPTLSPNCGGNRPISLSSANIAAICWIMIYGEPAPEVSKSLLIARFAINLGDAGGYPGGGGEWTQPGDWNSDPTTTLHLTVNGALSGRHNDPLEHPIYSYLPADNTTEAGYGCGGDGGHGGGGGGGASTIIVRQFATNKANSKDILALPKRHGYGSGGGKGGKGGDGCILIYY